MPASNAKKKPPRERRTIAGWRGSALDLELSEADLDLLDNVITVIPILRVVTAIGQEARRRGVRYPVSESDELQSYLGEDALIFGGHRIDKAAVARMPDAWFPITHEGELLSRTHLALLRCQMESGQIAPRSAPQPALQPR
jgi:hypothetical protein